jgi:hypothetical protein
MYARCAVMYRMESGPSFVWYVQLPRANLWNLNEKGGK